MTEISTLYLRPVLSIDDCCIIGRIADAYFDKNCKKIVYFALDDISSDYNQPMLLPFSAVRSISDAIVVQNTAELVSRYDIDTTSIVSALTGRSVYSSNGMFKGVVCRVKLRGAAVSRICTEQNEYSPSSFSSIGDVLLLKSDATRAVKKQTIPRPKTESTAYILNTESQISSEQPNDKAVETAEKVDAVIPQVNPQSIQETESIAIPAPIATAVSLSADEREPVFTKDALELIAGASVKTYEESDGHNPPRIICEYDFLLGRTLVADLRSYINEPLAYKGDVITHAIVERARKCGKLVELTLNSK